MIKLHVISEKYNDADILHVEEDLATKQQVEQAVSEVEEVILEKTITKYISSALSPEYIPENNILNNIKKGDLLIFNGGVGGIYECTYSDTATVYLKATSADNYEVEIVQYDYDDDDESWTFEYSENTYYQTELISGENISTVNGESLLDGGNLSVGKPLYKHELVFDTDIERGLSIEMIDNNIEQITTSNKNVRLAKVLWIEPKELEYDSIEHETLRAGFNGDIITYLIISGQISTIAIETVISDNVSQL